MARRNYMCVVCDGVNLQSFCANCINVRLTERYKVLKRLSEQRDDSRRRLNEQLVAKREADLQRLWRTEQAERRARLSEQLRRATIELEKAQSKGLQQKRDLDAQVVSLASASDELSKQVEMREQYFADLLRTQSLSLSTVAAELSQKRRLVLRQLCKILPLRRGGPFDERDKGDLSGEMHPVRICEVQLPVSDNLSSVSPVEVAASLGYMVQLVNLTAKYLSAPLLHSAGFAASSSRVWQRSSYFDPRPAIRSEEYPLFLPSRESQTALSVAMELGRRNSRSGSGSSHLGFSSMEGSRSNSLENSVHSPRSGSVGESYKDVQRGIKLLKRSVACINAYGHSLLSLAPPSDMSTFEVLSELLAALISKELRGRSSRGNQQPNGRFGLSEGLHLTRLGSCPPNMSGVESPSGDLTQHSKTPGLARGGSWNDFFDVSTDSERLNSKAVDSIFESWDIVDHPTLPPPPSHSEDVEHWTRAMFIDATK